MTQQLTFVILSNGLETFRELRGALSRQEGARILAGGDVEQVVGEISHLKPSAAIIALSAAPDNELRVVERVARECPEVSVICASADASPDLILRSLRAGAREFLRLPVIPEEFKTVYERTAAFCITAHTEAPKKRGRVIAVFSSKGGCGTTFIATNVAAAMNRPSVLVDLNLQAGDLGLFLGVEPKFSIADLVENRERVDDSLLRSYLTPHTANLSLLAAPREADSADDIEAEHIFEVLEILRERFDYIVIDPQHTFDPITLAALDQADDIVLVLTLDIPAIRSTQRALAIFDRLGYPRHKVHVVVNRFSKQIDVDLREVERYLSERVKGYVQSDYRTAVSSINLGQPLVDSEPASKIATELRQIAAQFSNAASPVAPPEQRRRSFGSLFRREKPSGKAGGVDQLTVAG